jgi:type I restriction enzyme S subunit
MYNLISPIGWQFKTIKDLGGNSTTTVQTGPFGAQLHAEDYVEEGIPFILIKNLKEHSVSTNGMPCITEKDALRLHRYRLNRGDVVFSRVGRVGSCFLAEKENSGWVISGQLLRIRIPNTVIHSKYLFYALSSKYAQDFILEESVGTTRTSINTKILESLSILVPPYEEQIEIIKILTAIDRAIEQAEAIIAKQQRIKTGLMHDLLTKGIDEHGNIRSKATHNFKTSPLGRIPVEWDVKPLRELAYVDRGKFTHRPRNDPRFYGGDVPFIQTGDVTGNIGRVLTTHSQTLNERGVLVSKRFPSGTIAITIAANIADTAILGIPMFFPDSIVGAIVRKPHNYFYIELAIRKWKERLDALAPQSAQKNINLETLRPLLIAVPSPEEQKRIADIYRTCDEYIMLKEHYVRKLICQKSGLMQDLLTGKVRVTNLLTKHRDSIAQSA